MGKSVPLRRGDQKQQTTITSLMIASDHCLIVGRLWQGLHTHTHTRIVFISLTNIFFNSVTIRRETGLRTWIRYSPRHIFYCPIISNNWVKNRNDLVSCWEKKNTFQNKRKLEKLFS